MNKYNQYYSDVVVGDKIVNDKCFQGSKVYNESFKINDYLSYKSSKYYTWINDNFKQYSFPDEKINNPEYNPEAIFKSTCNPSKYSLKPQQKFAARVMNTFTENHGMLIYHGLGSGKTQTSIIIGEAFKFRSTDGNIINNRADTHVLIVVPVALVDQYYSEIIGRIENNEIVSATGEILINGNRQYYIDEEIRNALTQMYL